MLVIKRPTTSASCFLCASTAATWSPQNIHTNTNVAWTVSFLNARTLEDFLKPQTNVPWCWWHLC